MIPYNIGTNIIADLFKNAQKLSLENEIEIFQEFEAFYQNDSELIEDYIKADLEPIYSKKTLDTLLIRHKDSIQKVLRLKVAGLFDNEPTRRIVKSETDENVEYDEVLTKILDASKYNQQIKEATKQALFFNTVLVQPIWRNEQLELDIYNHAYCDVKVSQEDYLKPIEVYLTFVDQQTGEVFVAVWTETDHYLLDANGEQIREWNGEPLANNYGVLPFSILRIRQGKDFWGEPNWNLLNTQKSYDISLTNFKQIELFQSFGVWTAINMGLGETERLSPNSIKTVENIRTDMQPPKLENVVPNTQFGELRNNLEWDWKTTFSSEGLAGNTSDTETQLQSGVSKGYDEIETQIQREDLKNLLYYFEKDLLEKCRIVYNAETAQNKLNKGEIEVVYSEEKPSETIQDKKLRREMEKQYNLKTEIDFAVEDFEIDRTEAIALISKNMGLPEGTDELTLISSLSKLAIQQNNSPLSQIKQRVGEIQKQKGV
jgi:hypothetical protein